MPRSSALEGGVFWEGEVYSGKVAYSCRKGVYSWSVAYSCGKVGDILGGRGRFWEERVDPGKIAYSLKKKNIF